MIQLLEGLPIILALLAIFACSIRLKFDRRNDFKTVMVLCMIAAALMLTAQTSWWQTRFIGNLDGEAWANEIWTIFNSLTMIIFILVAIPRKRKP